MILAIFLDKNLGIKGYFKECAEQVETILHLY